MFEGIQRRCREGSVNPPEVVYVDRDCCGPSYVGKKFPFWSATQFQCAWKQVLDPCDLKWISKALFCVNQQGKLEMCFDTIDRMWYFARPIFLWMPKKLWRVRLTCPGEDCVGQELISSGIYRTLRRVLTRRGAPPPVSVHLHQKDGLRPGSGEDAETAWTLEQCCQTPSEPRGTAQRGVPQEDGALPERLPDLQLRPEEGTDDEDGFPLPAHAHQDALLPVPDSVYCQDVLSRLDEVKAGITSVYGHILKIDSTKKVVRKLQGAASETAAWATNVGNEHGQVLISVITAGEGAGLDAMFEGIQRRYREASVNPPEVVYVDRDCCGPNYVGKKFPSWSATQVRLDIWDFMRRISSACTTESHALYPLFMRRLSGCIFQWSEEDLTALKEAKETQAYSAGVTVRGKEQDWLSKKELGLHCRRTTRTPVEISQRIEELIDVFSGEQGRDMLGTPLLDEDKARDVWDSQMRHVGCIQDPPNVSLYTQTGTLRKGTKTLPTYRCARGSTSLESFHLHLNRFIPGTSASDVNYQAFLLEGLYRWNQDRASHAVEVEAPLCHRYSGLLRHTVNHLAQTVLGNPLDPAFHQPRAYTGELIGVEYLYSQTGKSLQVVPEEVREEDPTPEEEDQDHDEGFEEEEAEDDPTLPDLDVQGVAVRPTGKPLASADRPPSSTARPPSSPRVVRQRSAVRSPARAEGSTERPTPAVTLETPPPTQDPPAQDPPTQDPPAQEDETEEEQMSDPTSGMRQVHDLADFLLQLRECRTLTRTQQDQLISLWEKLEPRDQRPAVFQARPKSSPPKGRFMSSKTAISPPKAGVEKTKRSFVGTGSGPASYPDTKRYMEMLVRRLMEVHTGPVKRANQQTLSRWSLILTSYNRIREVVTEDPRVSALTSIQLLPLNQTTLILWDNRRQKKKEERVLSQGIEISDPPMTAPPRRLDEARHPCDLQILAQPIQPPAPVPIRYLITVPPEVPGTQPSYQQPEFPPQKLPKRVPGSTACYRRKVDKKEEMGEYVNKYAPRRGPNRCSKCKEPKTAPRHRQYFGNWYCQATSEESYADWVQRMVQRGYSNRKRKKPPPDAPPDDQEPPPEDQDPP
ncbi:uncharacterized protein LOC134267127 [Saccostrea cucullata]|uniref:uncharacterized protein LOC134267127 n=1 Tax=Saccostrea cuccullata TaxID=36930 RepID=UPI002ED145D5